MDEKFRYVEASDVVMPAWAPAGRAIEHLRGRNEKG
jgi:hypothetical protein